MTRFAVLLLAAVQLVFGASPTPLQPKIVETYSTERELGLPSLPVGFVRTLSFSFSPDEHWIAVLAAGARAANPRKCRSSDSEHPAAHPLPRAREPDGAHRSGHAGSQRTILVHRFAGRGRSGNT